MHPQNADDDVPALEPRADELARLRRENAALRREVELRDVYVATIGHELRNPLSPIYLQVVAIQQALDHPPLSAEWLGAQAASLVERLHRFLATLDRLLDVSQIRAGEVRLELEDAYLGALVERVVAAHERELAAARATVRLELAAGVVGRWDRVRLEQIVVNLLTNAIRYGAGRPIALTLVATERSASLAIRDRGIGIAPDDHARIFRQFERASTSGRRNPGFGIGLWIVARLCAAMRGTVEVDSAPGEGATFTITLPRA
jgi:signal transduction histidine kinase